MATKKIKTQYYYDRIGDFKEGLAIVSLNGKYGYINADGKEVIPPIYNAASPFHKGLAEVKFKNTRRIIDTCGKTIESYNEPVKITTICEKKAEKKAEEKIWLNGLCKVKLGKKWGLSDASGNEIIAPKYAEIEKFNADYLQVKLNGKWSLVDMFGNEKIPPIYNAYGKFGKGLIQVKKNRKWDLVNMNGKEVTEIKYDEISGKAVRVGHLWGLLDENGNEIVAPKYFNHSSLFKSKEDFQRQIGLN